MEEYSLINKKAVKSNKSLKSIQKEFNKQHRHIKGHFPKAKLGKVVKLCEMNPYLDLTGYNASLSKVTNPDKETILNEIKRQGIQGLSGSGFPTLQKLQAIEGSKATTKYLIINAVECDPGLLHDKWLLENRYAEVEKGIELIAKCVAFHKIILATRKEAQNSNGLYEMHTVPNRYPMGAEKILIQEVLGIRLADQELPTSRGILVLNIQTIYSIYEAVYLQRPADSRLITVANMYNGEASIVRASLNTSIDEIVSKVSGSSKNQTVYYGGGIMSGKKAQAGDKVAAKTNFIGYGGEAAPFLNLSCKKCGACARKCPMDLQVHKLVQGLEKNTLSMIKDLHPEKCIKCGTCSYYCAAGKNTMELVNSCIN